MAYLTSGERPYAASSPSNPLGLFVGWYARARAAHARRIALRDLLEFDEHRLRDLGISRGDVLAALGRPGSVSAPLRRKTHWSGSR